MPIDPSALRELRNARGLTQQQLAEAAGLRQPAVARIEAGRAVEKITLSTVERLAAALRVPISRIISGSS